MANLWSDYLKQIVGTDGNDVLSGNYGNFMVSDSEVFHAGKGNDTLYGNNGNDTINNYDYYGFQNDKIVFGEGIEADDLFFKHSGNDLIITNLNSEDSITIKNHYSGYRSINNIILSNNTSINFANIEKLIQDMASFEGSTGMIWENAVNESDTRTSTILDQLWVKSL